MSLIKGRIGPLYNSKISLSQCGAVPGRGADLVAHAARSFAGIRIPDELVGVHGLL